MAVKAVLVLILAVVATSVAQKKCCFPDQFETLDGQVVGTLSQGSFVAIIESVQLAFDYMNQRAGQIALIQDGSMVYEYHIIVDYSKQVEYIINTQIKTCQMLPLPAGTNMSHCIPDDADYVSTYYLGDYLMMADSFSYAVKEGALEGTAIFSVSKGDCIPTSVTFMGAQQGTPVLEVAGFVNYTYGIQNPAKYFTIPDYCSQASSPEPRQYNSFIHRFF
ncbi:development-specific protein LVN1.2-like isoform X2 [Patiria miniata]|uniref:Uncharacterized protein n=1 Tax=Patiria miniata TaxID=46514 RepID=A0A914A7S3_PATMI|nr:development-specific protein LVN1.2-like isoform X2 [Patiria miniata]